jgi:hypothetical protein
MAFHVTDTHELLSQESLGIITVEEFEEARRDPEVIALLRNANRVLAERKAARERDKDDR